MAVGLTRRALLWAGSAFACGLVSNRSVAKARLPQLMVSDDGLSLRAGKDPFFWLGDTAWDLLFKLSPADAATYFRDRKSKNFNVVLAVLLSGAYSRKDFGGNLPFELKSAPGSEPVDLDLGRPNEKFFLNVDAMLAVAEAHGLYVGLLPMWGNNIAKFDEVRAFEYGLYLGNRYRDCSVIWVVGGDTNPSPEAEGKWRSMGKGLKEGCRGNSLITFHPSIGMSTTWFNKDDWLNFNSIQSGHSRVRPEKTAIYELVRLSLDDIPTKPVIDLESGYERIAVGLDKAGPRNSVIAQSNRLNAYDIRVRAYQTVFAGAFGYTYGALEVMTFFKAGDPHLWPPNLSWQKALSLPGASQVGHLRRLMDGMPKGQRVSPIDFLVSPVGWKYERVIATGDKGGQWFLVYSSAGAPFQVDLSRAAGKMEASWFNPREGSYSPIGVLRNEGQIWFTPPTRGNVPKGGVIKESIEPGDDWVLKLEAVR